MTFQPMSARQRFVLILAGMVLLCGGGVAVAQLSQVPATANMPPPGMSPGAWGGPLVVTRNVQIREVETSGSNKLHIIYDFDNKTVTTVFIGGSYATFDQNTTKVLSIVPLDKVASPHGAQ